MLIHSIRLVVFTFLTVLCVALLSADDPVGAAETRGIKITSKSQKGQAKNIQLYDYTAALIIGIDHYANLDREDQLRYAVKDARGMERVLRANYRFDEITTLYNEEATREKIIDTLYGFRALSPEAGLLVYFAGHGITMSGMLGGKDLGYLIPHDGSLDPSRMGKNISMQQIKSDVSPYIAAKHVFFVFDACFAGLMLDTRAAIAAPSRDLSYLLDITKEKVRQVTAGSKGQSVLDGGPGGHSVFTGRLIQNLEQVQDYITARELGQKLKKQVYGDAADRNHTQRPVDGEIYGTGDFVFVPDPDKRYRNLKKDVKAIEEEIARLERMKNDAARARDAKGERELERERLKMESKLKLAKIQRQKIREATERQNKAAAEAEMENRTRERQERKELERMAMLRMQAENLRRELDGGVTGGATLDSAVEELRMIKDRREDIERQFSAEWRKQAGEITAFYDKKIARLADLSPWDKEFETKEDYQARVAEAERKAAPAKKEKEIKLASVRSELGAARVSQVTPLDRQLKTLKEKRFSVAASAVSFRFSSYKLAREIMLGDLTMGEQTLPFYCPMPKKKARVYKRNPGLLVPEPVMLAGPGGKRLEKIVFHGPGEGEEYIGKLGVGVSDNGRFTDNGDGTVTDSKTGLMWASEDNGRRITWGNAKSYCENFKGGGYTDWRMPTQDELLGIYDESKENRHGYRVTRLIAISACCPWASETRGSSAASVNFSDGQRYWLGQSRSLNVRALPVRLGN